jgi:diguanylate cyclase (GGDEF)-like protein/PAS domain S-box-containing protein
VLGGRAKTFSIEYSCGSRAKPLWFLMEVTPLADERPTGAVVMHQDITKSRRAADKLREVERRFADLLGNVEMVSMMLDTEARITFCNDYLLRLTGWRREEVLGRSWFEFFVPSEVDHLKNAFAALLDNQPEPRHHENEILTRSGERRFIRWNNSVLRSGAGDVIGTASIGEDITEQKRARDELRELARQTTHSAEHDFLTDLPNRMLLNDRIGQAIALARRHQKKLAVLFLDLDGFKHINDSLGHPLGDKLLQSIAKRLVDCVRNSDTVSRQGGDEFVVLLSEVAQAEDAAISARRMLRAVAVAHPIEQHELHVTTSIGVSVYPDDGVDAQTLIKSADTAMYQAKENGRQGYQFFKPAMNVRAVERQFIEESLRRALERKEFSLHYQPKVNLMTGAIAGARALIRWTHPTRGSIPSAQFIPVAEDCGLILQIGNWALREACAQARAWVDAGLPRTTIAVSISALEFRDESFVESVSAILEDTGLDPRSLELELTEKVLMKRAEATESILQTLRERGTQIVIDDFGTGSSLSCLQKFPIDALKIDQSFVGRITTAPGAMAIVTAVISMGRNLKLRVVAEGVETQEELAFLQAHECEEAQGNYFSPALPAQQYAKLLRTGLPANSSFSRLGFGLGRLDAA